MVHEEEREEIEPKVIAISLYKGVLRITLRRMMIALDPSMTSYFPPYARETPIGGTLEPAKNSPAKSTCIPWNG